MRETNRAVDFAIKHAADLGKVEDACERLAGSPEAAKAAKAANAANAEEGDK